MSNLVRNKSGNLPIQISNKSKSIYNANSFNMIKNIGDLNIVANSIHTSINRVIADKGVNMNFEDMNYLKTTILNDVLNDFTTLTLEDVSLCLSMGVRGNLGEYFGINVVTIYEWLKKYKEELIPEAFKEVQFYLKPIEIKEEKIDYKKFDLEKVDNICNAINLFKKNKQFEFNDYGNVHYKFLHKLGYLKYYLEKDKKIIKEEAKQKYISKLKDENIQLIQQGRNLQMTNINSILEKIEYAEKDTESLIEIIYYKLLFKKFIVDFCINKNDTNKFKKERTIKISEKYEK